MKDQNGRASFGYFEWIGTLFLTNTNLETNRRRGRSIVSTYRKNMNCYATVTRNR